MSALSLTNRLHRHDLTQNQKFDFSCQLSHKPKWKQDPHLVTCESDDVFHCANLHNCIYSLKALNLHSLEGL